LPTRDQKPTQELPLQLIPEDLAATRRKLLGKRQPLHPNRKRILGLFPNPVLPIAQTKPELRTPESKVVKPQLISAYAWLAKPGGDVPLLMGSNLT
jgi:hypothetical protein